MTVLVVGASGATGKHLVEQLLMTKQEVKIIVRSTHNLPESWKNNAQLTIMQASILDISKQDIKAYIKDCDAIVSCLGHNLSWKWIYGKPRKLVRDAVALLCDAVRENKADKMVKFILMNTTGNSNRDIGETISFSEKVVLWLIRLLLPPHSDNEKAADYLRLNIAKDDSYIQWLAVRPDSLIDSETVSPYSLHPSPTRSAIFDAGKTSRINVAHFMATLTTDDTLWNTWKGQMPVIYNKETPENK